MAGRVTDGLGLVVNRRPEGLRKCGLKKGGRVWRARVRRGNLQWKRHDAAFGSAAALGIGQTSEEPSHVDNGHVWTSIPDPRRVIRTHELTVRSHQVFESRSAASCSHISSQCLINIPLSCEGLTETKARGMPPVRLKIASNGTKRLGLANIKKFGCLTSITKSANHLYQQLSRQHQQFSYSAVFSPKHPCPSRQTIRSTRQLATQYRCPGYQRT